MIILDTNVISEMLSAKPFAAVEAWLAAQPSASIFTTTITKAEILHGLRLLPDGRRRGDLEAAIRPIFDQDLAGRVLPFDENAADAHAMIAAGRRQRGRPISQFDARIAGIAASRGAAVATRNVADFQDCEVKLVSPWEFRP